LRRAPTHKLPVLPLLIGDVLTVGLLADLTKGLSSPFASLFFLVTLSGALYYDVRGGLGAAAAAVVLLLAGSLPLPGFWEEAVSGMTRTQLIPYLLLHGGVAGYLVSRLKRLHARRIEADAQLRALQAAAELRQHEAAIAQEIQTAALA